MTNKPVGIWTCGFLAGSVVGLAAGMLSAPRSGKRTRRMIQRRAEEAEDHIAEAAEEAVDRGREMIDRGQRMVDGTIRDMSSKVKAAVRS